MNKKNMNHLGLLILFSFLLNGVITKAQITPTPIDPPHVSATKRVDTIGEICPNSIIDVSITLEGAGTVIREPVDAIVVLDRSGSLSWGGACGWNIDVEPPYGPVGIPPYTGSAWHPYVNELWAAWKFYKYFIEFPPSSDYRDYGCLVFFGSATGVGSPPGQYPVPTAWPNPGSLPVPIQRVLHNPTDPAHKNFWWKQHLAIEPVAGSTALGAGMQVGRNMLAVMPTHPAPPTGAPGTPNPSTPFPPVAGKRYMVVLTDGRPNDPWTPVPGTTPGWTDAYSHAREMARVLSLSSPWGPYTSVYNTKIYTIGLGQFVDHALMHQLSDPFDSIYWDPTPTPEAANHGEYLWAQTEDDLDEIFETIASEITNNRAGTDIAVTELFGFFTGGNCPGGTHLFTDIIEGSWNIPPKPTAVVTPGGYAPYVWEFDRLRIGETILLTFQIQVSDSAPLNTPLANIECPESMITYMNYESESVTNLISDPGIVIGICGQATNTPTPTNTPTLTPTCIPEVLFEESFESGSFAANWDPSSGPDWAVRVLDNPSYSYEGDKCAYFAGCDEPDCHGENEAHILKIISLDNPIHPGAVLEFYVRLKDLVSPQLAVEDKSRTTDIDMFIVEIHGTNNYQAYTYTEAEMQADYFQVRLSLMDFAGDNDVRIGFGTLFPSTLYNPQPYSHEPMVFLDKIRVTDYCYNPTPTPTMTPTPVPWIPASTPTGTIVMIIGISILMIILPFLRRKRLIE
jgi:hypothetical protein